MGKKETETNVIPIPASIGLHWEQFDRLLDDIPVDNTSNVVPISRGAEIRIKRGEASAKDIFAQVEYRNKQNKKRLEEERAKANRKVVASHNLRETPNPKGPKK